MSQETNVPGGGVHAGIVSPMQRVYPQQGFVVGVVEQASLPSEVVIKFQEWYHSFRHHV